MTSLTFAVRWTEATGNGDLDCQQLFSSEQAAVAWLDDMEHGVGPDGHPNSTMFDHCGPRTVVPL